MTTGTTRRTRGGIMRALPFRSQPGQPAATSVIDCLADVCRYGNLSFIVKPTPGCPQRGSPAGSGPEFCLDRTGTASGPKGLTARCPRGTRAARRTAIRTPRHPLFALPPAEALWILRTSSPDVLYNGADLLEGACAPRV